MSIRNRRAVIAGALVLLGVAAYAGIGFLVLPGRIATAARDACRERYGRELALGPVRFNPFLLSLEIDGLRLPDADGGELVRWRRFAVEFSAMASLWRRGYVIHSVELDAPGVRLVLRPDGRWNLQDLLPPPSAPTPPKSAPGTPLPRLWVDRLQVRGGEIALVDRAGPDEHREMFSPVEFTLTGFSTAGRGDRYDLKASSPDLGSIEWRGTIDLDPVRSSGEFRFANVDLARVAAWAEDRLPFGVSGGTLGVNGSYDLRIVGTQPQIDAKLALLEVATLGLRARGATEDWVAVPRLAVSGVELHLPQQKAHVERIALEGARVGLALDAQLQPNLLRLFVATPTPAIPPPLLHWMLAPIDVAVTDVAWPADGASHLDASVVVDGAGRIAVAGALDLGRRAADLDVQASGIELAPLEPLLARSTSLVLKSGALGLRGKLEFTPADGGRFAGAVTVSGLRLADQVLKEDLVRWKSLELEGIAATRSPLAIGVHAVTVREPYARLIIAPDGSTNIADALAPPGGRPPPAPAPVPAARSRGHGSSAAPPPPRASAALPIEIAQVRIVNGSMNYADYTLKPRFATGILDLNGTIRGLSGKPGSRADVHIDGKVDRYAPVTIRGRVNYFAASSYTDLDMSFHNIELTTFSPYSGKFAGYRIDRGKLSLDTSYHIENRQLDAKHHLVIDQLELGEHVESPDVVSIPVKLAISLLKDRNGVIDLDLPVTGSIDDPSFALGAVIWKVVKNLLVKIVTSPFALLGSLMGGGDEMQYVDFAPGKAELDPAGAAKLGKLREALVARPGVSLDVPLVATDADARALAAARWDALLAEFGATAAVRADPAAYRRVLETAYAATFGRKPAPPKPGEAASGAAAPTAAERLAADITWLETQLRASIEVPPGALATLAKSRADLVQQALLEGSGIDPGRIFVVAAPDSTPKGTPEGPSGAVREQLRIH